MTPGPTPSPAHNPVSSRQRERETAEQGGGRPLSLQFVCENVAVPNFGTSRFSARTHTIGEKRGSAGRGEGQRRSVFVFVFVFCSTIFFFFFVHPRRLNRCARLEGGRLKKKKVMMHNRVAVRDSLLLPHNRCN